ncbi:hypothetical protein C8R43DRAFT_903799 [Mycena crocata]|nr:hypothetical protein C8R43DRAFT_903799 [Mycena crocata]
MPPLRTRDTHQAARSLELSTAAPPSLAIISPTPRTFSFPVSHNLSDSPPSSPSNSPFEPDLRTLALSASPCSSISSHNDECRTPPPFSSFTRTLSPVSAPSSPPSAAARRKSSSTGPEERRPKKGDDDYVKRPENAFILFRRKCCEDRASSSSSDLSSPGSPSSPAVPKKKERQADLSKTISQQWKALPPAERAHWEELAKAKKREHEALHPGYVYRPQRTRTKNRASTSTTDANTESSEASSSSQPERRTPTVPPAPPRQVEFVVPAPRTRQSRSASAPPYQAVQIPDVYSSSHSYSYSGDGSDNAASLMPIIARRGVGNGSGGFDYMPSVAGVFDFEANLQVR